MGHRLTSLLVVLLLFLGCRESTDTREAVDSVSVDAPAGTDGAIGTPDTLVVADSAGTAVVLDPSGTVRVEGACPFECCVYGMWTTSGETTLFAEADNIHSPSFTVPAETELDADRGHVTVRRVGRVMVKDEVDPERYWGLDIAAPGDTLLVLDYVGEGHFHFWLRGRIHEGMLPGAPGAWTEPENEDLVWLERPVTEWWAHVTLPDGRDGWLWMEHTPQVYGADACG